MYKTDIKVGQEVIMRVVGSNYNFMGRVSDVVGNTVTVNGNPFSLQTGQSENNLPLSFVVATLEAIKKLRDEEFKEYREAIQNEKRIINKRFGTEELELKTGGIIIFADVPVYHSPESLNRDYQILDDCKTVCFVDKITHDIYYLNYKIEGNRMYESRLLHKEPSKQGLARKDAVKVIKAHNNKAGEYNRYYICLTGYN